MQFFWYDYETWGKSPLRDRIVQFGGVRTNEDLEQIAEPLEFKCKPGLDCFIGPGAVSVHGITPMEANDQGISEAEFAARIHSELTKPGSCNVAYNGMGFDHEFTRLLFYRNLRDPYTWAWKDGNSAWDTIGLMRAAFLLRPDALPSWPQKQDGRPSFKLEDLSAANLELDQSVTFHDATTDAIHTWKVAKLVRERARDLWEYALKLRSKKIVRKIIEDDHPVLYVVGKIGTKRSSATFLSNLKVQVQDTSVVHGFDLFHDPAPLLKSYDEWTPEDKSLARYAIWAVKCNKSPFVCRLSDVKEYLSPEQSSEDLLSRLKLTGTEARTRHQRLMDFIERRFENPFEQYIQEEEAKTRARFSSRQIDPDEAIYDGFFSNEDLSLMGRVLEEQGGFDVHQIQSTDSRIEPLIFRFLARNFPEHLDDERKNRWIAYCHKRQFEQQQQRWVTADQIFSYELRDCTPPLGALDDAQVEQLVRWQDWVRERLNN